MRLLGRVVAALVAVGLIAGLVLGSSAGSRAAVTPGVKPDFVLGPDQRASKTVDFSALVNVAGATEFHPDGCRTDPTSDLFCDAFRIKLKRSTAPDARNLVRVVLTWDAQARVPDLALVAAGLGVGELPDLDMYVYDKPDHALGYDAEDDDTDAPGCQGCEGVGGRGISIPELLGFTAVQDEYDIVIQAGTGVLLGGYTITVILTDELFETPAELLEELGVPSPPATQDPGSFVPDTPSGAESVELPTLTPAPVTPDAEIAGIGLGVNEQFDSERLALGGAARTTASRPQPPSNLALVVGMGLAPIIAAAVAVEFLRRRRYALI